MSDSSESNRGDRIRQGHAQRRIQALPPPGKAPFGYKRGKERYLIDRTAAPIVKAFFEHFLLYGSLRGAVRHIAQNFDKEISVSTGRYWLINPVYRGDLAYAEVEPPKILRDTHSPLLSRDEAAQIDRLLRRNQSLPPRTASASRSLAGLVTCTVCQEKMTIASVTQRDNDRSYLYLRCMTCPQVPKCASLPYDRILHLAIAKICSDLPQAVLGLSRLDAVQGQIATTIAKNQNLLQKIPDLIASGILDLETGDLRTYNLRTEIADMQNKLSQLPPTNLPAIAQTLSIPQFWLDLSEAERRFYFREFLRAIRVNPTAIEEGVILNFVF